MSDGLDILLVREHYRKISDQELIYLATENASGLTPEAMEVVKEEIRRRNLNPNIQQGIEAQNRPVSREEILAYCEVIQNMRCPVCGSAERKTNATQTGEVSSIVIFSTYKRSIKVACPDCLDKANNKALLKTVLLGWWGIPHGIIYTIRSIILNIRNKSKNHQEGPTDTLQGLVLGSIGKLATYGGDSQELNNWLSHLNNS